MIQYQGDDYRDDRIFVINLTRGTVTKGTEKQSKWLLVTYRNTVSLPAHRSDKFDTQEEAINYIKQVEPDVPLICNRGQPLDIPDTKDRWKFWIEWLANNGLKSATTGHQNVPDWVKKEKLHGTRSIKVVQLES